MTQPDFPFSIDRVPRIPLEDPPLERVVFQVRFPSILSIRDEDHVAPFQEALRHRYPTLRKDQGQEFEISGKGVKVSGSFIWRLRDRNDQYTVSLAPNFLALDVGRYDSRSDFIQRISEASKALGETFAPATFDRVGVRYLDRVAGMDFVRKLSDYVRPELLGTATAFGDEAGLSTGETSFSHSDAYTTTARWGVLPPETVTDPRILGPLSETSWFLDVDTYVDDADQDFDPEMIGNVANACADADYRFFRWAVFKSFLRKFGGEV